MISENFNKLFEAAKKVRESAHVPYSNFKVGAAIRTVSGKIFAGCNVENAAYPQGTCAEAGAIAAMILGGEVEISEIVVFVETDKFITPCGGCRQKISEFCNPTTRVILVNKSLQTKSFSLEKLLPGAFVSDDMVE